MRMLLNIQWRNDGVETTAGVKGSQPLLYLNPKAFKSDLGTQEKDGSGRGRFDQSHPHYLLPLSSRHH